MSDEPVVEYCDECCEDTETDVMDDGTEICNQCLKPREA
jgi:hypothetical protein